MPRHSTIALFTLFIGLLLHVYPVYAQLCPTKEIAATIAAEAANQGEKGLYAVACTIKNRALAWNKTPYEIVSAKNQYYGFSAPNRLKRYAEVKEYVDWLAKNIMELEDITGGALFFRLPNEPRRKWHKIRTCKIGAHEFYK